MMLEIMILVIQKNEIKNYIKQVSPHFSAPLEDVNP